MDGARFDRLTRTLSSRRSALGGLLGAVAGLLGLTNAEAAPCPKGKNRCAKRCIPKRHCCTNANCPKGSGKVCRRGRCVCPASRKRCRNRCIPKASCCGGCLPGQVCQQGTCCYPTTAAFQAALAPGGPAVIPLCAGTAYIGNFQVQRSVTVVGAGATSTILNGGGTGTVVTVIPGVVTELRGLQLTNGWTISAGAGLDVRARATVTLRGCLVRGNTAVSSGVGAGFRSLGDLTLIDTVVSGNTGVHGGGGLVTNNGIDPSTLILRGATRFEGNQGSTRGGGLLVAGERTTVEFREDSIVTGNTAYSGHATSGGGIYNHPGVPGKVAFFDRSRVTGNTPNNCTGVNCPA